MQRYVASIFVVLVTCCAVLAQHKTHVPVSRDSGRLLGDGGGARSSATVTFGAWMANSHICPTVPPAPITPCPIVDRFPPGPTQFPARFSNIHIQVPEIATIQAGGTVNFIIAGLHVVAIYNTGTRPSDIDVNDLVPNRPPNTPPIINDPTNRIYRGLDPLLLPPGTQQDRVEAVHFSSPGLYLVICAVLPHFQGGMYGYVRVVEGGFDVVTSVKK